MSGTIKEAPRFAPLSDDERVRLILDLDLAFAELELGYARQARARIREAIRDLSQLHDGREWHGLDCGHSACSQHYIETGARECIAKGEL